MTRLPGAIGGQALTGAVACYLAAGITAGPPAFWVSGPVLRPRLACDGK